MVRYKLKIYFVLVATVLVFQVNGWAQQPGAGPKSSERPAGAITGHVINSAGEPLSGASVSVVSLIGARSQSATVNNDGEFKIDGLEPGLYRIFTGMTGYVSSMRPGANDSVYYRIGDSVTFTLVKGAVITGTVTGPNGPLVRVGVFVARVRDEEGKKMTPSSSLRERSTDDRGVFRFYGLQPGTYIVSAARPRIGVVLPSAYDNDAPTYFPSGTRDTASEITVHDGDEITTDIQYRAEPGHAVSGNVAGIIESQERFSQGASLNLIDVQSRLAFPGTATNSSNNNSFAFYGVPDGEYELSALQYLPSGEGLRSATQRVPVRGGDVTGLSLTLAPLPSIEGRLIFENDPKAPCASRKETAAAETIVRAWRSAPEKTPASTKSESSDLLYLPANSPTLSVGDAKGSFLLRNLQTGTYRIDPQPPASGWYLKSIAIGTTRTIAAKTSSTARDGIALKSGERVAGLLITIAEGASRLRGRISVAEGQRLPRRMTVYLVPVEREAADNVLRFYEARPEADQTFTIDNIHPGRYFIVAHPLTEEKDTDPPKSIRRDSSFRTTISQEAAAAKKEISFKPCERIVDYELPYSP
jgi:hypothetical protein